VQRFDVCYASKCGLDFRSLTINLVKLVDGERVYVIATAVFGFDTTFNRTMWGYFNHSRRYWDFLKNIHKLYF